MNKGISLTALATEIERQKDAKHDLIAPTKALTMNVTSGVTATRTDGPVKMTLDVDNTGDDGHEEYGIQQSAHRQLADRLGIPTRYYDRMAVEAPHLLAKNVNEWLHRSDDRRMIRTLDGNVRAFLSDKYQRIDNAEIAEVALPVLAKLPEVQIVSANITEHRMYIQAVTPRLTGEVKLHDAVQAGVIISNSEIGAGAVTIAPMLYRLVCLNGMIVPDQKFRAYHVGRRVSDSEELWADDTRQADDRAVLLKVRDMIEKAVSEVNFRENLDRMAGLTTQRLTGDPRKVVEVLAKKVNANEVEQGGILRSLIEGGDLSAWGLLNAVTAQAHVAEYDRAVEFEQAGGTLLTLPSSEWHRMLEAA